MQKHWGLEKSEVWHSRSLMGPFNWLHSLHFIGHKKLFKIVANYWQHKSFGGQPKNCSLVVRGTTMFIFLHSDSVCILWKGLVLCFYRTLYRVHIDVHVTKWPRMVVNRYIWLALWQIFPWLSRPQFTAILAFCMQDRWQNFSISLGRATQEHRSRLMQFLESRLIWIPTLRKLLHMCCRIWKQELTHKCMNAQIMDVCK